jgi:hypothetical protein
MAALRISVNITQPELTKRATFDALGSGLM